MRKDDDVCFVFQPQVAIDTITDADKKREAENIVQQVQPEHQALISKEILRRQAALRENLPAFNDTTITKYEIRLLETDYWDIVIQIVQGKLLPPNQAHTSDDMAVEDENVKFGGSGSTDGHNPIPSSAASVRGDDGGINDAAGTVNIGNLVRLNNARSNHSPANLAALAFTSAKAALSGQASGVRFIYECYLISTDYTIRGGTAKKR